MTKKVYSGVPPKQPDQPPVMVQNLTGLRIEYQVGKTVKGNIPVVRLTKVHLPEESAGDQSVNSHKPAAETSTS